MSGKAFGRRLAVLALGLAVSAGGLAVSSAPAAAAVPDAWGFAYVDNPTPAPGTVTDPARQWGSWKAFAPAAMVTVDPIGVGRYRVRFPFLASGNGVAHVTAVGGDARYCQVWLVYPSGADQIVEVQCYKNGGFIDPTRFTVMYSTSSGLLPFGEAYAYVQGHILGGTVTSYNSMGAGNSVAHVGPGQYQVFLSAMSTGILDGNVQVTAQHPNSPRRCKLVNWITSPNGHTLTVNCYDQANVLTDTWFDLSYYRKRALFGALAPPNAYAYLWTPGLGGPTDYNSFGGINSVAVAGVGLFHVRHPLVGVKETHVQITAYGQGPNYCNLQAPWTIGGSTVDIRNVICFDGAGNPKKTEFLEGYASRA